MSLYEAIKNIAPRYLPDPILQRIKKIHYVRRVRRFDPAQEPDLVVVRALVRSGDHVVDVGASVGLYSVLLSQLVGPKGKVWSIEPIPPTFEILRTVVEKLALPNVKFISCAASSSVGERIMEIPVDGAGRESYYEARLIESVSSIQGLRRFDVRAMTLDGLLGETDRVDFIKIDVEEHELECIIGATALLDRFAPALMIEVSTDPDGDDYRTRRLSQELEKRNYEMWLYDGLRLRRRVRGDRHTNYFFLQPGQIRALHERGLSVVDD